MINMINMYITKFISLLLIKVDMINNHSNIFITTFNTLYCIKEGIVNNYSNMLIIFNSIYKNIRYIFNTLYDYIIHAFNTLCQNITSTFNSQYENMSSTFIYLYENISSTFIYQYENIKAIIIYDVGVSTSCLYLVQLIYLIYILVRLLLFIKSKSIRKAVIIQTIKLVFRLLRLLFYVLCTRPGLFFYCACRLIHIFYAMFDGCVGYLFTLEEGTTLVLYAGPGFLCPVSLFEDPEPMLVVSNENFADTVKDPLYIHTRGSGVPLWEGGRIRYVNVVQPFHHIDMAGTIFNRPHQQMPIHPSDNALGIGEYGFTYWISGRMRVGSTLGSLPAVMRLGVGTRTGSDELLAVGKRVGVPVHPYLLWEKDKYYNTFKEWDNYTEIGTVLNFF